MDEYRRHIADGLQRPAIEFFATFSRFEFALKRGGFVAGEIGKSASPDWNNFAEALGDGFYAAMRNAAEARIFFEAPPRTLKLIDADSVEFRDPAPIANGQMLFEAIRAVRNNLFHGEKVRLNDRDANLMTASLHVLDAAMAACDQKENCRRVPFAFAFAEVGPR